MNIRKFFYLSVISTILLTNNATYCPIKINLDPKPGIAAGLIAYLAYYLSDFVATTIHELGHATAAKAVQGKFPNIDVFSNPSKNVLYKTIKPFAGITDANCSPPIVNIAGPIAGIMTKSAMIYGIKKLRSKLRAEIKQETKTTSIIDMSLIFLKHLITFSLISEISYGFMPLNVSPHSKMPNGDGQKLWEYFLNRKPSRILEKTLPLLPYILYYTPWIKLKNLCSQLYKKHLQKHRKKKRFRI